MQIDNCRVHHDTLDPTDVLAIAIGPKESEIIFIRSGARDSGVYFDESTSAQLVGLEMFKHTS
jgi:hypothetical protein